MTTLNQLLIAEATEYEFKSAVESNKPRGWLKTVSAFANGVGGSIYFGVSDDGVAIGLDNAQKAAEQISELIKVRIEPAVKNIVLEPHCVDGKEILRVQISGGANTPYYYTGDGTKIAYYRIGNESAQAPAAVLNELLLKGLHQTFDALETKYRLSDYSYTLFEATYKQKTGFAIDKPRDYRSFGMLIGDDTLTYVGALFADQCPIYQSRVFCTRWNGLKKGGLYVDALDNDEFQSNVISLLTDALKFVRHNSSVKWKKTGTGRIEMPDYPSEAVHEALVNALVHRDYMIQGSEIHVDMYDDRLEIASPGGMPDGKRIQDLNIDNIPSIRRNPIICDLFSRLKLMERRGSGLRKIIDQYPEDAVPLFRSTEQSFVVTLKNLNYAKLSTPHGDKVGVDNGDENNVTLILNAISEDPKITQKNIAIKTGLSTRTVSREIRELRDTGVIRRIGSDRSGYWEIVK
ncbi:MAG: putative DNA binding domain-containing protein [Dethiobacter sp.]|jgi:ATP-dependent DNA helicase RecG|nr:putative DNA binding domain-containing protein [Dethiobacter sp.]MBS3989309.1 putative DNA binding domain-containing protein [Dethiobacter sp.]